MYLKALLVSCLLSVSIQTVLPDSPKPNFKNIIAFGDSYTDNGSFSKFYKSKSYRISKSSLSPSTSEIERHADGPLWVEYLIELFDNALLFDFARSGATVINDLISRPPEDMYMQIEAYIESKAPTKHSIYFLWMGVNDIFELFKLQPNDNPQRQEILDGVIDSIHQDLVRLYKSGANHIMLLGLIPLETAFIYSNLSTQTKLELKNLVSDYNQRLTSVMTEFQQETPMISSSFFNMHRLFQSILDQSQVNAATHCDKGTHCKDLVWWDNLHPSTSTHLKIANAIYKAVLDLGWQ
ncbi:GDSL lipase/esterase [Thamnidium elegans]|nr:GDSL lipase/esterase [Thamnidium elegans]